MDNITHIRINMIPGANPEHLKILLTGVSSWNRKRAEEDFEPLLMGAQIYEEFEKANKLEAGKIPLSYANLRGAQLFKANLSNADLESAQLQGANLFNAKLEGATLSFAQLEHSTLEWALLPKLKPRWNLHFRDTADRGFRIQPVPCPVTGVRPCQTPYPLGNVHPTLALV